MQNVLNYKQFHLKLNEMKYWWHEYENIALPSNIKLNCL